MRIAFIDSIDKISAQQWNSVAGIDYPFTRHEFLHALEITGAVTKLSGWQPQHLLVYDNNTTEQAQQELIAVMPLYLKYHSYGEYIFDWSWADAYQRNNVNYYPKLLSSIPYTPAAGQRLCIKDKSQKIPITQAVTQAILEHAKALKTSSAHILFLPENDSQHFVQLGLSQRLSVQYHWFNTGFSCFDDFLATFNARKRKNLNKERRTVAQQAITLQVIEGESITTEMWNSFFHFYQLTYIKRSGHAGYLKQDFFELIGKTLANQIVLVLAFHQNKPIAGALSFRDSNTLYGRYWGCTHEFDYLHFETCYYQGIEYCIKHQIQRFDPGAQGEHKIQRGFTPIQTWSNHWIADPNFSTAIDNFLHHDRETMAQYMAHAKTLLPFKKLS